VRNGRYCLVCDTRDGSKKWELFDLQADPGEKHNVATAHREILSQMEKAYDQWWQSILPCLENENAVGPSVNPFKELYWKQFGGGP
jgi:arylsulfatase